MHRRPHTRLLAALALCALAAFCAPLVGCSEGGELEAEPGSVREALYAFNAALKNRDKEEARRWVLPGASHQRAFEIIYLISKVQQDFLDQVTEKWGKSSLKTFQEPPGAQLDEIVPYAPREVLEKVIVNEVGEIAIVTFEDGQRQRLVRSEGRWLVDTIGSDRPEDLNVIIPQLKLMEAYAKGIEEALKQIDQPDVTADYFDLLLGRQLDTAVREYEQEMTRLFEEAQKQAEQEQQGVLGPARPGSEPPPDDPAQQP